MIPVYFVQNAFQLTELFQIEIDAVIYTDQFTCYIGTWTRRLKFIAILNSALGLYRFKADIKWIVWYIWSSDHFNVHSFKAGKFTFEDSTHPGRPITCVTKANIAAVKIVVEQDARLSVKDIASCTGISEGSVETILKKHLDLRKGCTRWVPHLLTEEQKKQHLKCAQELLKTLKRL